MYARSTTIHGKPAAIDDGIAYVRQDVMPALASMEGCAGLSLVVNRLTGRIIVTSSWETMEAMGASIAAAAPMRARGGEIFGGEPVVDKWEVVMMHREHATPGAACCRISWAEAASVDASVERFKRDVLPLVERAEGFCSASMFVNRLSRRLCGTVTFDSRAAMAASRELADERRATITNMTGMYFTEVAEFDVVLAHLRVPELV
jgi:heme-degrading monooxygenase HmoA